MKKRMGLLITMIVLLGGVVGCSGQKMEPTGNNKETANKTTDTTETSDKTSETEKERPMEYGNVTIFKSDTCSYDKAVSANVKAMSLEGIQELNENNCTILYNEQGKISFINGQYTDYTVSNVQEAYNSLMAVKDILELPMESIAPIKMTKEENVGTYYMFGKQESGSFQNGWVLHVVVDCENVVQGLGIGYGDSEFGYGRCFTGHAPEYSSNEFFETLIADEATAKDIDGNEVTIPVMYSEERDTYYMGDLERRIVVGVYEDDLAQGAIYPFLESKDNTWDDPQAVTVLTDLIKVYDYFAEEFGIYSVDGSGIPIMFYVHGSTYDTVGANADYCGVTRDYAWFNISDDLVGNIMILAHEYTHGVFGANSMGAVYANDTGSINEGYADLFGNMVNAQLSGKEQVNWYGRSEFPEHELWYSRCPEKINSWLYKVPAAIPTVYNDFGGVHYNGAFLAHLANGLEKNYGLTNEEQRNLWKTTLSFTISDENYDTLKQQLLLSARLHNHEDWNEAIETEFANLGFVSTVTEDIWLNNSEEGCGRLVINYEYDAEMEEIKFIVGTGDGSTTTTVSLYRNTAGTVTTLIPAGDYHIGLISTNLYTGDMYCSGEAFPVEIKEGEITTVDEIPEESLPTREVSWE